METAAEKELREAEEVLEKTFRKKEDYRLKLQDSEPERVFLVGCGSSHRTAMILESEMRRNGIDARAVESSEMIFSEWNLDSDDLVIGISQSGETTETIKALQTASRNSAKTAAIINTRDSTMDEIAGTSLYLEAGEENAVLATKSVDAAIATGTMVADILGGEEPGRPELAESLETDIQELVDFLVDSEVVYFLGQGSFKGVAGEAATKLGEGPLIPSFWMTPLEFSHGPKSHAPEVSIVYIAADPRKDSTHQDAVSEFKEAGADIAVLSHGTEFEDTDVCIEVENSPLPVLKVIQRAAVRTAVELDEDPDNPPNLSKYVEKDIL